MDERGSVELAPLGTGDFWDVGGFLHEHLNPRISAPSWAAAIVPTWAVDSPNHGFLLRHDGRIVGVQLAFYSRREIDGEEEDFCNLGAWCVLEPYRSHGLRMLRALLSQRQYGFTDLSPTGNLAAINQRLRFQSLDTTTAPVPNLPVTWPHASRVSCDPAAVGAYLDGRRAADPADGRPGPPPAAAPRGPVHAGGVLPRSPNSKFDRTLLRKEVT